jgi:hypothetical protein
MTARPSVVQSCHRQAWPRFLRRISKRGSCSGIAIVCLGFAAQVQLLLKNVFGTQTIENASLIAALKINVGHPTFVVQLAH